MPNHLFKNSTKCIKYGICTASIGGLWEKTQRIPWHFWLMFGHLQESNGNLLLCFQHLLSSTWPSCRVILVHQKSCFPWITSHSCSLPTIYVKTYIEHSTFINSQFTSWSGEFCFPAAIWVYLPFLFSSVSSISCIFFSVCSEKYKSIRHCM